jgi:hypothetical protein
VESSTAYIEPSSSWIRWIPWTPRDPFRVLLGPSRDYNHVTKLTLGWSFIERVQQWPLSNCSSHVPRGLLQVRALPEPKVPVA